MSTALAIAATTRVLTALIDQAIQSSAASSVLGSPPFMTSKAPDQLETGANEASQLALFLYNVTFNTGWEQEGLPSRNSSGTGVDRPPLALDLHYMLIAYGETEYVPQVLLGLGMQALHETPFLARDQIAKVFTPPPPLADLDAALATADLGEQIELIKVSPEPLTTEDLSKLWTASGGRFRPSAGYEATVVLIQSSAVIATAPPVLQPNIYVGQLRQPNITAVTPLYLPWASSLTLTLQGTNLTGANVSVVFDGNPASPQTPLAQGTEGTQAGTAVPTLPAGINTLRIVREATVGALPPKTVSQSNVSLFYLQPVIRQGSTPPNDDLITVGPVDNTKTPPVTPVTVQLDPVLEASQQVQLLLNELDPPAGSVPFSFTFDAQPAQISANSVTFSTFLTRPGPYLVRVRVDGAESALRTDSTTHAYAHPLVTL